MASPPSQATPPDSGAAKRDAHGTSASTATAKVLLVGCGDLGTALGLQLSHEGHRCYGLRRQCNQLPDAIQAVCADLNKAETLNALPSDIDYLVVTLTPAAYDAESYQKAYVEGLRHLLAALDAQGQQPRRLFFVSSTAVYHQQQGEWVDETSETVPQSFSGETMLDAEALLQQWPHPTTSLRLSGIYGPSRNRLIHWALDGVIAPTDPPHYSNRIHREDAVAVLKHLIKLDMEAAPVADIYLGSDPNPSDYNDILQWIRAQLGVELTPGEAINKKLRAGSKRCYPRRLLDSGFEFRYPDFRTGFASSLAAFKNQSSKNQNS